MSEIEDISAMSEDWRSRLAAGIKANKKTRRGVSLAAGMGAGYVSSLLKEEKDPTIDNLLKICAAADVSVYYVLYGVKIDRETEEIIQILSSSKTRTKGLLQVLRNPEAPENVE